MSKQNSKATWKPIRWHKNCVANYFVTQLLHGYLRKTPIECMTTGFFNHRPQTNSRLTNKSTEHRQAGDIKVQKRGFTFILRRIPDIHIQKYYTEDKWHDKTETTDSENTNFKNISSDLREHTP